MFIRHYMVLPSLVNQLFAYPLKYIMGVLIMENMVHSPVSLLRVEAIDLTLSAVLLMPIAVGPGPSPARFQLNVCNLPEQLSWN